MAFQIQVSGIEETCRNLSELVDAVKIGALTKGLAAGAEVIEREVWRRTPIDMKAAMNSAHGGKGIPLAAKLQYDIVVDSRGRGGVASIHFGDLGHIALWVEYGHQQVSHATGKVKAMTTNKRGKQVRRWRLLGKEVIGQVRPRPFMRPASAAVADQAVEAFWNAVQQVLSEYSGKAA